MKRAVLFVFLTVTLTGCAVLRWHSNADRYVVVHYYPYTVSTVRTIAKPYPDYENWDETRMRLDLERLSRLGMDIVMVAVTPDDIQNDGLARKYLRFTDLAVKYSFKVAFMADAHRTSAFYITKFGEWCAGNLTNRPGYFYYQGQPLVELHEAVAAPEYTNSALTIRHTTGDRQWVWGVGRNNRPMLSANGEQTMAFAGLLRSGDRPESGFLLPRRSGATIRKQFRRAAATGAKFICVASYNDFYDGSFVEPNTFDGHSAYKALQSEIWWFK